jgi:hypothetical protein
MYGQCKRKPRLSIQPTEEELATMRDNIDRAFNQQTATPPPSSPSPPPSPPLPPSSPPSLSSTHSEDDLMSSQPTSYIPDDEARELELDAMEFGIPLSKLYPNLRDEDLNNYRPSVAVVKEIEDMRAMRLMTRSSESSFHSDSRPRASSNNQMKEIYKGKSVTHGILRNRRLISVRCTLFTSSTQSEETCQKDR